MITSLNVETREILLPSLYTVHGHIGVETTRDHHCVRVGVRNGAGRALINKLIIILTAFNTYPVILYFNRKPGSWVLSGLIRVVVFMVGGS